MGFVGRMAYAAVYRLCGQKEDSVSALAFAVCLAAAVTLCFSRQMILSVAALGCGKEIEEMRVEYERRRDFFIPALNAIPGVKCHCPEGAFYAWVRFDIPGMDAEQVGSLLLEKAKVVAVPGSAYGTDEPYVRFSFASPYENLVEAAGRIAQVVGEARS